MMTDPTDLIARADAALLEDELFFPDPLARALRDALAAQTARVAALEAAIQAAIDCGMVPKSSAKEGGANKYSEYVRVADMLRAALTGKPQP